MIPFAKTVENIIPQTRSDKKLRVKDFMSLDSICKVFPARRWADAMGNTQNLKMISESEVNIDSLIKLLKTLSDRVG